MSNILPGDFPGPVPTEAEIYAGLSTDLAETGEQVMSSVEIAELCEKEHRNVMRDIRSILGEAGIDALRFERVYLGGNGQQRPCYYLPRFECDLVITGYSVPYRAAVIKRWHELEARVSDIPVTRGDALRHAAELSDKNEEQALQLEAQQPAK